MKSAIALAITLASGAMTAVLITPVLAATSEPVETVHRHIHHHYHYTHHHPVHRAAPAAVVAAPAPIAVAPPPAPGFRPYPPGQGDTDGLSRDEEDCEKGCIGGNPQ